MSSTDPLFVFGHSYYVGSYISGILYGVNLVLYYLTLQALFYKGNDNSARRRRFFATYSTIFLVLITMDIAINAIWGEFLWIDGPDSPGGTLAWFNNNVNVWYQAMGSTTSPIMIFMGDALLIYRLFILYGSSYYVIALPLLAYFTAIAFAIIQLFVSFSPSGNFFSHSTINWGIPYYSITIGLNILITLLIVTRLLKLGKAVSRAIGDDSVKMYTSVASMLIESAAPYSLFGIVFLVAFTRNSMIGVGFIQVWSKLTCICPQMIILRVATGRAWGRDAVSQASSNINTLQFAPKPRVHTTSNELQSHGISTNITAVFADSSTEKGNADGNTKSSSSLS
jgi:hypothetical protein